MKIKPGVVTISPSAVSINGFGVTPEPRDRPFADKIAALRWGVQRLKEEIQRVQVEQTAVEALAARPGDLHR